MPSLSVYNITRIYSKVEDYETKNKTCVDTWIQIRENGSSLNFISLLNSAVGENWVCQHCLLQFILRKCCCVYVPSYANVLWMANLLNVSTFYMHEQTFLLFSSAHFIACELQSGYSIISFVFVWTLILGNAVRIFHAIDAKYVMFCVSWCKFLKGSTTPGAVLHIFLYIISSHPFALISSLNEMQHCRCTYSIV